MIMVNMKYPSPTEMKPSIKTMKNLGFTKTSGGFWVHNISGIYFNDIPSYKTIVRKAFDAGVKYGEEEKAREVRKVLKIG